MVFISKFFNVLFVTIIVSAVFGSAPLAALEMKEVAPGLFVHFGVHEDIARTNQGDIANIGFVIGEEAVAVIDTGGSFKIGSKLRAAIRHKTDLPIRYVILTHVHPDHIFGAGAFEQDNPVFVGHARLINALATRGKYYLKRLKEDLLGEELSAGTKVPEITKAVPVSKNFDIDLGNRRLTVQAYPSAHTDNDLTVYDHSSGAFWLSDLLFQDRIPRVDGSIIGWIKVLDDLAQKAVRLAIPGHGPVFTKWPKTLGKQRDYLEAIVKGVRNILKAGGSLQQATKNVAWHMQTQWTLFEDYHPGNVTAAFVELEWE